MNCCFFLKTVLAKQKQNTPSLWNTPNMKTNIHLNNNALNPKTNDPHSTKYPIPESTYPKNKK